MRKEFRTVHPEDPIYAVRQKTLRTPWECLVAGSVRGDVRGMLVSSDGAEPFPVADYRSSDRVHRCGSCVDPTGKILSGKGRRLDGGGAPLGAQGMHKIDE